MNESELREKLEQVNSEIKLTQKRADEKKKAIETLKRSKEAEKELLSRITAAESVLKSLKEQDESNETELQKTKGL